MQRRQHIEVDQEPDRDHEHDDQPGSVTYSHNRAECQHAGPGFDAHYGVSSPGEGDARAGHPNEERSDSGRKPRGISGRHTGHRRGAGRG